MSTPTNRGMRLHKWACIAWVAIGLPVTLIWPDSVFWVGLMSLYANIVGHWSAYEAAKPTGKR